MHNIAAELATLDRLSTGDLAERYAELHGQPCSRTNLFVGRVSSPV